MRRENSVAAPRMFSLEEGSSRGLIVADISIVLYGFQTDNTKNIVVESSRFWRVYRPMR